MPLPEPVPPAGLPAGRSIRRRWARPPTQLIVLPQQTVVRIRAATRADLHAVQDLHRRCSADTRYARYHAAKSRLTTADWAHLNRPERAACWLESAHDRRERVIAMANLVRHAADPSLGYLDVMVEGPWQRASPRRRPAAPAPPHAERHRLRRITATVCASARHVQSALRAHGFHRSECLGATIVMALNPPQTRAPLDRGTR